MRNDTGDRLVAFILTNGRPDRVFTYDSLRRCGYTGPIYLIVDDLDPTREQYLETFGDQVIVFDKRAVARTFDNGDNFDDLRAIIYARNASFDIAEQLGIRYFIQLDDDYRHFQFRFGDDFTYHPKVIRNLDAVFEALLEFYIRSGAASLAFAQGGDFIGGPESALAEKIQLKRKCMNSFICSTERRFQFVGRVNEDVNTYTRLASTGLLLLTTNQITLEQTQTQANAGGMTEMYLESGTYVKSFYSVMYQPSSVRVAMLQDRSSRLHHKVAWKHTVPKLLREELRKPDPEGARPAKP
jgi:hypothetical protein